MLRIAMLSAILVTAFAAPALAERNNGESIPPNCTLDPWTKELNCPVPKATMKRRGG